MNLLQTIEQDGHVLEVLTHPAGSSQIAVSRTGAELISLRRLHPEKGWLGYLWRDGLTTKPASGWTNHSTVMGYFLHRLKGERSVYHGKEIRGGNHSFLRAKLFSTPELLDGPNPGLRYRIGPDQFTASEYPYQVSLELDYVLHADRVHIAFRFKNHENHPAHVSFGLHPGFTVSDLAHLHLRLPEGRYARHYAPGNFLSGETLEFHHEDRDTQPYTVAGLPDSFIFELISVPDPVITLDDPVAGRRLKVHMEQCPYLTLWSDGNAFVCIEPCWGLPDHQEQRPFENKLGIQIVPPRGTLEAGCAFEALLL